MPDKKRDGEDFASLVGDAKPLAGRDRQVPPSTPKPRVDKARSKLRFVFPDPHNPLLGCAEDCDRKLLDRLRRGRIEPTVTVDLHGLRKVEAREELIHVLREAWEGGEDCVLVVHGRGLGSESGPVLKRSIPSWLLQPPLADRVLAFAPARSSSGGAGASFVLLRPR